GRLVRLRSRGVQALHRGLEGRYLVRREARTPLRVFLVVGENAAPGAPGLAGLLVVLVAHLRAEGLALVVPVADGHAVPDEPRTQARLDVARPGVGLPVARLRGVVGDGAGDLVGAEPRLRPGLLRGVRVGRRPDGCRLL